MTPPPQLRTSVLGRQERQLADDGLWSVNAVPGTHREHRETRPILHHAACWDHRGMQAEGKHELSLEE